MIYGFITLIVLVLGLQWFKILRLQGKLENCFKIQEESHNELKSTTSELINIVSNMDKYILEQFLIPELEQLLEYNKWPSTFEYKTNYKLNKLYEGVQIKLKDSHFYIIDEVGESSIIVKRK